MINPIKISLEDYVQFGGGANGESFDCISDPSLMLKLYFPGKIQQPLDEMMLARKVYDLGVPTPEPGEYVVTASVSIAFRARCPMPVPRGTIRRISNSMRLSSQPCAGIFTLPT